MACSAFTMSTKRTKPRSHKPGAPAWIAGMIILAAAVTFALKRPAKPVATASEPVPPKPSMTSTTEINQAVMVTVDLDFGGGALPTIAEAIPQIERRYQPADGTGRTFAILDAYGQPTAENKLRVSMHVSAEKVGGGSLLFRRTGEVLWSGRFTPMAPGKQAPHAAKNLMILVDNGRGKLWTIDGSSNPLSVLEATIKELGQPLKEVWADGQDREFTFLYSTCGCPVKVMTRREGDRTRRTSDLPVIFPDDPTVASVIGSLMRW
jgi:hypothetical protein